MRDEKEGRKKQARSDKQTTRQSNTAHPRQSLFLRKISDSGGTRTHGTLHSRQSALPAELHVHVHNAVRDRQTDRDRETLVCGIGLSLAQ